MLVVSLGDLVLDVAVRPAGSVARGADTPAHVSLSAGGQGANVAAWVAALGGMSRWLGKRAADAPGRLVADQLGALGVELCGPVASVGNGVIVALVEQRGERSMFLDRGIATQLEPDEIRGAAIDGGESRAIAKGDVIIVPSGTPHWLKDVPGPPTYYVVKVR